MVAVAAAIVSFSKAWEIIRKILHPESDLREKVKRHDEILDNDNKRLQKIEAKLDDTDKFKGVMCRAMLAQLEGNDEESRRAARKELNDYLTQR